METFNVLQSCENREIDVSDNIYPTRLFSHREDVIYFIIRFRFILILCLGLFYFYD